MLTIKFNYMPDKKDKGKRIIERPDSEPIIKSDVPDFEYTPTPPEPNTDRNTDKGKKE